MRKKSKYTLAVVGVGAVGIEMLRGLKERRFPVCELRVLARSSRDITVDGQIYHVEEIAPEKFEGVDIALFAGTEGEKGAAVTYAPEALKRGAVVIDNGADFRLDPGVPLVVPEVNPKDIKRYRKKGIIANPNCSTIQMVVALYPIHKIAKIRRVIVSTYQAASGAGNNAVKELFGQTMIVLNRLREKTGRLEGGELDFSGLAKRVAFNATPQIGGFSDDAYTTEEWKMVKETHKIMHDSKMRISATAVRIPVKTGHGESIYLETRRPLTLEDVRRVLSESPGIEVVDDVGKCDYPLPVDSEGRDEVFVGRIRRDPFYEKGLWLWVVADNLRKGAATNAIQIAELLIRR